MSSGCRATPDFRRYDREQVLKPAISSKKSWGGYRRTTRVGNGTISTIICVHIVWHTCRACIRHRRQTSLLRPVTSTLNVGFHDLDTNLVGSCGRKRQKQQKNVPLEHRSVGRPVGRLDACHGQYCQVYTPSPVIRLTRFTYLIKGCISLHSCQILYPSETGFVVSAHRLPNITLLTLLATL